LAKTAEFMGRQAGYLGLNLASQSVIGGITAPEGMVMEGMAAPFLPENLAVSALSQLPFLKPDISRIRALNKESSWVRDYAKTYERYDTEKWKPVRERYQLDQLRAAVDERTAAVARRPLGLPAPRTMGLPEPRPSAFAEGVTPDQPQFETRPTGPQAIGEGVYFQEGERPTPGLTEQIMNLTRRMKEAKARGNMPVFKAYRNRIVELQKLEKAPIQLQFSDPWIASVATGIPAPVTAKIAAEGGARKGLISTDSQVVVGSAHEVTGTDPVITQDAAIEQMNRTSVDLGTATVEQSARVVNQAKRQVRREKADVVSKWKAELTPEEVVHFDAIVEQYAGPETGEAVLEAVSEWVKQGSPGGVAGLEGVLSAKIRGVEPPPPTVPSEPPTTPPPEGPPTTPPGPPEGPGPTEPVPAPVPRVVEKAQAKQSAKAKAKQEKEEADKVQQAQLDQAKMDVLDKWMKDPTTLQSEMDAFSEGLRQLGGKSQEKANTALISALDKWYKEKTRLLTSAKAGAKLTAKEQKRISPDGLRNYLVSTAREMNKQGVNKSIRDTMITFNEKEAGGPVAAVVAARQRAAEMRMDDPGYYYGAEGNRVVRSPWMETAAVEGREYLMSSLDEMTEVVDDVEQLIRTQAEGDEPAEHATRLVFEDLKAKVDMMRREEAEAEAAREAGKVVLKGKSQEDIDYIKMLVRRAVGKNLIQAAPANVKKFMGLEMVEAEDGMTFKLAVDPESVTGVRPVVGQKKPWFSKSNQKLFHSLFQGKRRVIDAFVGSGRFASLARKLGFEGEVLFNEVDPTVSGVLRRMTPELAAEAEQLAQKLDGVTDPVKFNEMVQEYPDRELALFVGSQANLKGRSLEKSHVMVPNERNMYTLRSLKRRLDDFIDQRNTVTQEDGYDQTSQAGEGDLVVVDLPYTGTSTYRKNRKTTAVAEVTDAIANGADVLYFNKWSKELAEQFRELGLKVKREKVGAVDTLVAHTKVPQTFGADKATPYIGERKLLGQVLADVGMEQHLDDIATLVSTLDKSDAAYATLLGGGTDSPMGVFTTLRNGQRMIMLAAGKEPVHRKVFVFAHEYNGHYLWDQADSGRLNAETTQKLNRARQFIHDNGDADNALVLKEMFSMLPKEYQRDTELLNAMLRDVGDKDEVMANINAIATLALVAKGNQQAWRQYFTWMPKPLTDLISVFVQMGRKVSESVSSLFHARKMEWTEGTLDPEAHEQLKGYLDGLYEVIKYDNQAVAAAKQAMKLDMASGTPRDFANALADGTFNDPVTTAGAEIVRNMGAVPAEEVPGNVVSRGLRKLSRGLQHTFFRQASLAMKYPLYAKAMTLSYRMEETTNRLVDKILPLFGMERKGTAFRALPDSPIIELAKNPQLNELKNKLQHRAARTRTTVQENIDAGDADTMAILDQIPEASRQKVREAIVRQEGIQNGLTDISHMMFYKKLERDFMGVLMLQNAGMKPDVALKLAEAQVAAIQSGQPLPSPSLDPQVQQNHAANVEWLQFHSARIEKNVAEFRNHPEFITHRRFGKFAQKVFSRDETYRVEDFQTEGELNKWKEENKQALESGDLLMRPLRKDKQPFNVAESGLEFLQGRLVEKRGDVIERLTRLGIDQEQATRFAEQEFDLAAEMRRELASRQLPSSSPKRRLVAGYENLDTLFQQMEYMQVMTRSLSRQVANSEMSARLLDQSMPEEVRVNTKEAWDNARSPDAASVKAINKASYIMFMTLHPLNMLQDFIQPFTGALPTALINDGGGVMKSYGHIMRAFKDIGSLKGLAGTKPWNPKGKLTKEEYDMIVEFQKGNRGLASFTDMESNDVLQIANMHRVAEGIQPNTLGQELKHWASMGIMWQKNFHKMFTNFGMETAMLTSYRHYRAKGLSHADAQESALNMSGIAMDALGRGGRASGLWGGDKMRSVPAVLTVLQTYAWHQIGTWKSTFERAIGEVEGMSKQDRTDAWKALGTHTASMFAQAGILGLPFVGAIMALIDKTFGINSKEEVARVLHDNLDPGESHIVQQAALHGLVNAMGGVDYATRAQTPGVLGINARDGFSPESLLGPSYSIVENLFGGVSDVAQGDVVKGATRALLPNNLRRAVQFWRDDWEFRRQDGSLIDESTPWEKSIYAVLGLKPANIASRQEHDSWMRADAEIQSKERAMWLDDVAELLETGDMGQAKRAILERVKDRPGETPSAVANQVVDRMIEKQSPRDTGRMPGASEALSRTTGVPPSSVTEMQRLQLQDSVLRGLGMGLPPGRGQVQRAQQIDQIRQSQPWISYREAADMVDQMTGRSQMSQLLGGNYGQRPHR